MANTQLKWSAIRYVYAMFKTRPQAEDFLEHMWASGDVGSLEQQRIERRGGAFAITLNG